MNDKTMTRPSKLVPGKFYSPAYDGVSLRQVFVEETDSYGKGSEIPRRFKATDLFLFVESVDANELAGPHWDGEFVYNKGEKHHHFLLGEKSIWLLSRSVKDLRLLEKDEKTV